MRLVFIEPDIPQNLGAAIRLSACFDAPLDIIEPCSFPLTDKAVRRAAMDYSVGADIVRHASWSAFAESDQRAAGRLILLTTKSEKSIWDVDFQAGDLIALGSESSGAAQNVHDAADLRVRIPLAAGARSLNVAVAAGIALAAARRIVPPA